MTVPTAVGSARHATHLNGIYVYRRDLLYVRGIFPTLDEEGSDHALMLRWSAGVWGQYVVPAVTVAHCAVDAPERTVLSLTPDGRVHVARPNGFAWETVDGSPEGPNSLRHMIDLRPIGGEVYAAGMGRMVYRRSAGGEWARFDEGMRGPRSQLTVSGLRGIDGHSAGDIYAAGIGGEIWHCDGRQWEPVDSPTNVRLERVRCVAPDRAYVCGVAGTLLEGGSNGWRAVEHDATERTLWGMEWFEGHLYLADGVDVYRYDGENVRRVETGVSPAPNVSYLHAGDGVLAAVGHRRVLLFDGEQWTELALPDAA